MILLIVFVPSSFFVSNVFEGLVWFLLPSALIVVNDIMAYLAGGWVEGGGCGDGPAGWGSVCVQVRERAGRNLKPAPPPTPLLPPTPPRRPLDLDPFQPPGFFFGRTPLIKLSPKKTWEGFIGGVIGTVAAGYVLADWMSRFKWMTCPRRVGAGPCLPPRRRACVGVGV